MDRNQNIINCEMAAMAEHVAAYNRQKFIFCWGHVTHPGIWAFGGGNQELPPILLGVSFQAPQSKPENGWWCYIGTRPEFENEMPFN